MVLNFEDGFGHQALDAKQHIDHLTGNSVVSGVAPSAGSSGLEVDVASGTVLVNGSEVSVSAQTVTLDTADSSNPRKDVITIDSNGNLVKNTGTAEAIKPEGETGFDTQRPAPNDLAGVSQPVVAEVYVAAGASSLGSGDVRDRRLFSSSYLGSLDVFGDITVTGLVDSTDLSSVSEDSVSDAHHIKTTPSGSDREIQINDSNGFGVATGVKINTGNEVESDGHKMGNYKISHNSSQDSLDFEYVG